MHHLPQWWQLDPAPLVPLLQSLQHDCFADGKAPKEVGFVRLVALNFAKFIFAMESVPKSLRHFLAKGSLAFLKHGDLEDVLWACEGLALCRANLGRFGASVTEALWEITQGNYGPRHRDMAQKALHRVQATMQLDGPQILPPNDHAVLMNRSEYTTIPEAYHAARVVTQPRVSWTPHSPFTSTINCMLQPAAWPTSGAALAATRTGPRWMAQMSAPSATIPVWISRTVTRPVVVAAQPVAMVAAHPVAVQRIPWLRPRRIL